MDFIANYGLFLLKAFTLVFAFLFTVMGVLLLSRKPKPKLEIKCLNKEYKKMKAELNTIIYSKKIPKEKHSKQEKKAQKNKPSLYVMDFNGDIKASQVEQLREEITAILALAKSTDEVLIRLESPGGSVNGYGLAAAQLQRLRHHNIPLTVCIDKVAASGGYLMSCVANTIIAAPFAIVGSIGVVAQLPNLHRWLKKKDIDVELVTAGEYKRTLTLLGENTDKGRKKFQEDLEKIHHAFSDYVLTHRPALDMKKAATGEHWLAVDALPLHLIDHIQTSDDFLIEKMHTFNAYQIKRHGTSSFTEKLFKPFMSVLQQLLLKRLTD